MIFSILPTEGELSWDFAIDAGLDLAILSIGATGALFENPILMRHFGPEHVLLLGLAVVALNFILSASLLALRRFAKGPDGRVSGKIGTVALIVGVLTITIVGGVVAFSYYKSSAGSAPPDNEKKVGYVGFPSIRRIGNC